MSTTDWRSKPEAPPPTPADLEAAAGAIAAQSAAFPYLVYLLDKSLLFDEARRSFVMYGVQGRTCVALGDPVGPPDRIPHLLRLFLEHCDDFAGVPVFYQVTEQSLYRYADFGLTFFKLGEEARVDLGRFRFESPAARRLRQTVHRLEKERVTFRVLMADEVPAVLDQLEAISDDWLRAKSTAEKGFSLGFFDRRYVARFPAGLLEREGRILAFATLWPGPQKIELSSDLMRHHHDAPTSAMEALFVHLIQWGQQQGYRWFGLGVAPLSGFESSPTAPLWTRLGGFVYRHGGPLYNFQGLRAFKDKFHPVWEPLYLACPGGLRLPRILADVSALIAGGYRRIFRA